MRDSVNFRVCLPVEELLDAGEEIGRLLEGNEVLPPLRSLLLVLDDAITETYRASPRALYHVRSSSLACRRVD